MQTLLHLPSHGGRAIKIIESSAFRYYRIGLILLDDRHGDRVTAIVQSHNRQVTDIMREIYREWLAADINCSWATLTDCFWQCDLNNLAYSIEKYFGIPSPKKTPLPSLQPTPEEEHDFRTSGYSCGISSKIIILLSLLDLNAWLPTIMVHIHNVICIHSGRLQSNVMCILYNMNIRWKTTQQHLRKPTFLFSKKN